MNPQEVKTDSPAAPPRPMTSSWAAASLLCSVAICCPAMTLISVLLGMRALVQINAEPGFRGRGMAKAGIVVGSAATLLWIGLLIWWHYNARVPMQTGPRHELQAGMAGDVSAFKAGFFGAGEHAPDEQARQFLSELESRYGRFLDSQISEASKQRAPMQGKAELPIPYTLSFARKSVEAEAVFITFAPTRVVPQPVFKWISIRIIDSDRGDLAYPVQ